MTELRPQDESHEPRHALTPFRTYWYSWDLGLHDEPLMKSLLTYRQKKNRIDLATLPRSDKALREQIGTTESNLISSKTDDGRQMPVIDLDFPHSYVPSTQAGHGHLYLDVPISNFRFFLLMTGLYLGKQIELGYYIWSLRRGGNFVRTTTTKKTEAEAGYYTYGWFFKKRVQK